MRKVVFAFWTSVFALLIGNMACAQETPGMPPGGAPPTTWKNLASTVLGNIGNLTSILVFVGLIGLIVWAYVRASRVQTSSEPSGTLTAFYVLLPMALIVGLGTVLGVGGFTKDSEIQLGFLVVIAVIALITLLFIVAAGFAHLQLADAKQALGLPEGSIRAMIALILIMVFVILSVYLFRLAGAGNETGPTQMTFDQLVQMKNVSFFQLRPDKNFDVWIRNDLTADGLRIAQQLVTTLGTLVVAVAGFYFGSSSVSTAAAAVRGTARQPTITSIVPLEGKQNAEVSLTITGRDFQVPRAVRLARGTEEMLATDVMASTAKVTARVKLEKAPGGDNWDVVVVNDDGTEARLDKAFKIS